MTALLLGATLCWHPAKVFAMATARANVASLFMISPILVHNAQLTDGGPPPAPELPEPRARPPFGEASGSDLLSKHSSLRQPRKPSTTSERDAVAQAATVVGSL